MLRGKEVKPWGWGIHTSSSRTPLTRTFVPSLRPFPLLSARTLRVLSGSSLRIHLLFAPPPPPSGRLEERRRMIKGIFIINNNGKPRLIRCYEHLVRIDLLRDCDVVVLGW